MNIRNIIIVDDDEDDSEFFTTVINELDTEIKVVVANSKAALFANLKESIPDIIFIDSFIQLDSGLASISQIKADSSLKDIPIVMYTGSASITNIDNAFKAGAACYIVKPHSLPEIKKVLDIILKKNWKADRSKQYYIQNNFQDYIPTY